MHYSLRAVCFFFLFRLASYSTTAGQRLFLLCFIRQNNWQLRSRWLSAGTQVKMYFFLNISNESIVKPSVDFSWRFHCLRWMTAAVCGIFWPAVFFYSFSIQGRRSTIRYTLERPVAETLLPITRVFFPYPPTQEPELKNHLSGQQKNDIILSKCDML